MTGGQISEKRRRSNALARADIQRSSKAAAEASAGAAKETAAHPADGFGRFAAQASAWVGSKWAFALAGLVIVVWAVTGPLFHYSDTWQLVINTGTTIVTFLMVFLIQNTQNRDARAINLKLNELIHAIDAARNQMIDIESLSDVELTEIQEKFVQLKDDCAEDECATPDEKDRA